VIVKTLQHAFAIVTYGMCYSIFDCHELVLVFVYEEQMYKYDSRSQGVA